MFRPSNFIAIIAVPLLLLQCNLKAWSFDQSHQQFTDLLKKYTDRGMVHYRLLKEHPEGLNQYLETLANLKEDEYKSFTSDQQKAFWINAYNALTIKNVLDNYPIQGKIRWFPADSIRQVEGFWEDYKFKVMGHEVTLYTIIHQMIRRGFHDPRMHFAVVPASCGTLPLRNSAYVFQSINEELDQLVKQALSSKKFVQFDRANNVVRLSKIFAWFPLDFMAPVGFGKQRKLPPSDNAVVLDYVLKLSAEEKKPKEVRDDVLVAYLPYDWALNDADRKK